MDLSLVKSKNLWYIVGLITTDGNLSIDGRHINITSKDGDLLEKVKIALCLNNKIGKKSRGSSQEKNYFVLQFSSISFYSFLKSIGLTIKKSLTLKELNIPDEYFNDFLRGVIDGDGTITSWVHNGNGNKQWAIQIASGSIVFSRWLKNKTETAFQVKGQLHSYQSKKKKNFLYTVRFGKFASKVILQNIYYKNCLCLERKLQKALECLKSENGLSRYGEVVKDWSLIKSPGAEIGIQT